MSREFGRFLTMVLILFGSVFSAFAWVSSNFVTKDSFGIVVDRVKDMSEKIDFLYQNEISRGKK